MKPKKGIEPLSNSYKEFVITIKLFRLDIKIPFLFINNNEILDCK